VLPSGRSIAARVGDAGEPIEQAPEQAALAAENISQEPEDVSEA
jgi:hypothetical protein